MKTIIVNAGPRKNWNTSKLLKAAKEGSEAAGMETEYVELYDFVFTGPMMAQYKMIGNAVPPQFAKIIAEALYKLNNLIQQKK